MAQSTAASQQKELQELIQAYKRRLHKLRIRVALEGIGARPADQIEIEDIERHLLELQGRLKRLTETVTGTTEMPPDKVRQPSPEPVRIFLSYAREDKERVEKLYQDLASLGFKPWMDIKDILPGESWKMSIQGAIRRADFFLACLSPISVNKRGFVQKEIKEALDLWREKLDSDIYLTPVRLEDCKMPEGLGEFQRADLFAPDGLARLVKALKVGMERRQK